MTDHDQIYIKELAKSTLAEWLACDEFTKKASQHLIQKNTRLGREMMAAWGPDRHHLSKLWNQVKEVWRSSGWVEYEENTLGPRSFGTSDQLLELHADRMDRRGCRRDGRPYSDATQRWIGSMTGTGGKRRFAWLTMNYEALVTLFVVEFGPLIDGMTRDQVAEKFGLPLQLTKLIIKQLIETGSHREVRRKHKDGTRERQVLAN